MSIFNCGWIHAAVKVSLLKAAHSFWIIELVAAVWPTGHSRVLIAWTASATKHSLLRVLKSWTLLLRLLLRLLLHQRRWHKFSDLDCRDEDDENTRSRHRVV